MEALAPRGRFITIEGPEGAGKTTVARMLRDHLAERIGPEVVLTTDPGGEPISDRIRDILLHDSQFVCLEAELFLFLASRAQTVRSVIEPALKRGAWVISDRFSDSTLAYQGFGRGLDVAWLRGLNDFATGGLRPDLTILLDLPPDVGLERQKVADRIGGEDLAFHQRVRDGYLVLAREEPQRIIVVDARKNSDEVFVEALGACLGLSVDS